MTPFAAARLTGLFYLVIVITGLFAEAFVRGPLVDPDNLAATAANLLEAETLFRIGGAAGVLTLICDVLVAYLLYEIFKPLNAGVSLLTAIFRLVFTAAMVAVTAFHFSPLVLLGGGAYVDALPTAQLEALSHLSLRVHSLGFAIALAFFGVHCILLGWLIVTSRLMPYFVGLLVVGAGCAYLINTLLILTAPTTASAAFPFILLPAFVGEITLTLWLLVFGVDSDVWRAFDRRPRGSLLVPVQDSSG
jgi:hypothetical protein